MIFGYCRISTQKEKQKTDRQTETLREYAKMNNFIFDFIYEERISGKVKAENRPEYEKLKNKSREGDIIVITDVDRLGRNADDTIMELKKLKLEGIRVVILDVPYLSDWNNAQNSTMYDMIIDIMITLKTHIAQQEREKTVQRINQGIRAAQKKGKKLGRPEMEYKKFKNEYKKFKDGKYGDISVSQFCRLTNIGRTTYYKYIKKEE